MIAAMGQIISVASGVRRPWFDIWHHCLQVLCCLEIKESAMFLIFLMCKMEMDINVVSTC